MHLCLGPMGPGWGPWKDGDGPQKRRCWARASAQTGIWVCGRMPHVTHTPDKLGALVQSPAVGAGPSVAASQLCLPAGL